MSSPAGKNKEKRKRVEEVGETEPEEEGGWSDGLASAVHLGAEICTDDYWYGTGHEEEEDSKDDMQMLDPNEAK